MALPVVIGVISVVALLNFAQVAAQLALVQLELLDVPGLAEEVEGQQGQRVAGRRLRQPKNVKLPVLVSVLQSSLTSVAPLLVTSAAHEEIALLTSRIWCCKPA